MNSNERGDAWAHATTLVEKCLPYLPPERRIIVPKTIAVGPFEYEGTNSTSFRFSMPPYESIVDFGFRQRMPENLLEVAYWDGKGFRHSLSQYEIHTDDQRRGVYPRFSYRWSRHPPEGGLDFLKVDLSGDTLALYERPHFKARKSGENELLSGVPEFLVGQDAILGVDVPWHIDFNERSWDILDSSGLEEFAGYLTGSRK